MLLLVASKFALVARIRVLVLVAFFQFTGKRLLVARVRVLVLLEPAHQIAMRHADDRNHEGDCRGQNRDDRQSAENLAVALTAAVPGDEHGG